MKNFLLTCSLLFICIACDQTDNCQDEKLSVVQLECEATGSFPDVAINNNYVLIGSKEIYDILITGNCHPVVDFTRYDLLVGRQSSGNEVDTILYDLRRTCPGNELTLTVDVIQSLLTRPDNVVYHALIPKLGEEETLLVKINIK